MIEQLLSRINGFRKALNEHYLIDKGKRNIVWHKKVQELNNSYKNSLNDIKIGKIVNDHFYNVGEINRLKDLVNEQQFENLMYNNKISRTRDMYPVFYVIKDNKIYFMVQTSQLVAIPKPFQDALDTTSLKEYIPVIEGIQGKYFANAIYVIEAKNIEDLANIIEDVEQNTKLKDKFLGNQSELTILKRKEKIFEIFHKKILNKESIALNEGALHIEDFNCSINVSKGNLIDVTFDKYIEDNVDIILHYEKHYTESLIEYFNYYKIEDTKNKNDSTDI